MTQVTNYIIPGPPASGAVAWSKVNDIYEAVLDDNAGPSAPPNPVAGMRWRDTSVSPSQLMIRNDTNTGWITSLSSMGVTVTSEQLNGLAQVTDGAHVPAYSPIEFLQSSLPVMAARRFILTKRGSGAGNVTQSFAVRYSTRDAFTMHDYAGATVFTQFDPMGAATQTGVRWTKTPSNVVGHQGLSLEQRFDGTSRFWSSANYDVSDGKGKVVRFSITADALDSENLLVSDLETYVLYDYATGDGSTSPTVSPDGRFLTAKVYMNATTIRITTWLLKTLSDGGPGDYTDQYVHQFDVAGLYDSTNYPLQGLANDGAFIYALCGYTSSAGDTRNKRLAKFSLDGVFSSVNDKFQVGLSEALSDGTGGHYEPESLFIADVGGRPCLACIICSGEPRARVTRVFYLNAAQPISGRGADEIPAFHSTGINDLSVPTSETMRLGHWDSVAKTFTDRLTISPNGAMQVNNGAGLVRLLRSQVVLDFPSIPANDQSSPLTVTVTGAAVGDMVCVTRDGTPTNGIVFTGYVSSANTVAIRALNVKTAAVNPASDTYTVVVLGF
jgi:hypothetical protein